MKILILDDDILYIQRFEKFFVKKYTGFQISVFDNLSDAEYAMKNMLFDIILFGEKFDSVDLKAYNEYISKSVFAYFSSKDEIINETETIFKYRNLTEIHKQICEIYEKNRKRVVRSISGEIPDEDSKQTELLSFIPVHGGAGSSTMAAACALYLAKQNKVLYMNFEQRSSEKVFFENNCQKGLSDIIYAFKSRYTESGLCEIIRNSINPDVKQTAYSEVMCINGYKNIIDCTSINDEIIEKLFEILKNQFDYRYIIIDADYIVGNIIKKIIFKSDKLICTSCGSDIANIKHLELNRYLDVIKRESIGDFPKKYLIFNQYYGMESEYSAAEDMEVIARLARYRSDGERRLSSQSIIDEILSKNIFELLK